MPSDFDDAYGQPFLCAPALSLNALGSMRIAILLAALPSAAPWCQHRERDGRILECLRAKIPVFTPLDEVRACFAPCMIAAYGSLGDDAVEAK